MPTNLGEQSRAAVQYGVEFSRKFGAKLFLLHVLDADDLDAALETERVLEVLAPDEAERPDGEPSPEEVARNAARHDLSRLLALKDEQDTHAEYLLRPSGSGGPADTIVACARELDVELIVMGKHQLGFVEHMLAGSVTEKVLRHAPCPVLIVHTPEHDFVVADAQAEAAAR